jgi:hypothetical protein
MRVFPQIFQDFSVVLVTAALVTEKSAAGETLPWPRFGPGLSAAVAESNSGS